MPTIIGYHEVEDAEHWLNESVRDGFFGPLGVTNMRTFVDPENPKRVALMADVPDLDALAAKLQTPEGAEVMAADGVKPETLVILVES